MVAPDLLDHLRAAYDDSEVTFDARGDAVRTVDLLALDDFGAQSDAAWAREKLYQLVNYRVHPGAQQPPRCRHVQLDRARVRLLP